MTAFFIVIGMAVIVGGINTMLSQEMGTSQTIKDIAFAKVQALYLAEMALNQVMFDANKQANITQTPPAFSVQTVVNNSSNFDFTNNVWLTRPVSAGGIGDSNSQALCTVTCLAYTASSSASFRVDATLKAPGSIGTFTKRIDFSTRYVGGASPMWQLSAYKVY